MNPLPNRRNVALLHYSAPPVVGGVESVMAHHACLMADAGHAVRVIAGRGAAFDERVEFLSVPLVDSRHPDVLAVKADLDRGRVPDDFAPLAHAVAAELESALRGVDILIAHNVCSLHKNLALVAALYSMQHQPGTPPLILWHHDLAWTTPRYREELHPGYPWDLLRTDWGARHVVVSELRRRELAELMRLPLEAIRVVPNGVEPGTFLKLETQTRELVGRLGLADRAPLLLLPVRLTPRKNIELALSAFACLRRTLPEAALVVTGPPGPHNPANAAYLAKLAQLRADLGVESGVHFLAEAVEGYLPDAVVADFYRLSDALILPSREEGFGSPLLEAGLSRLPVFCADIPPLRELGGADACYFSPDAEPAAVADMIAARLVENPQYRFAARVRQRFTWGRIYAEYLAPLLATTRPGGAHPREG